MKESVKTTLKEVFQTIGVIILVSFMVSGAMLGLGWMVSDDHRNDYVYSENTMVVRSIEYNHIPEKIENGVLIYKTPTYTIEFYDALDATKDTVVELRSIPDDLVNGDTVKLYTFWTGPNRMLKLHGNKVAIRKGEHIYE